MKKIVVLLFVGSVLTFASCQSKPKTEEAAVDSTAVMSTDTTTMTTDSAAAGVDSAATMAADSAK